MLSRKSSRYVLDVLGSLPLCPHKPWRLLQSQVPNSHWLGRSPSSKCPGKAVCAAPHYSEKWQAEVREQLWFNIYLEWASPGNYQAGKNCPYSKWCSKPLMQQSVCWASCEDASAAPDMDLSLSSRGRKGRCGHQTQGLRDNLELLSTAAAQWCTPVVPAVRRPRQKDHYKFKASLTYWRNFRKARATQWHLVLSN